jgi:hypothetical protein
MSGRPRAVFHCMYRDTDFWSAQPCWRFGSLKHGFRLIRAVFDCMSPISVRSEPFASGHPERRRTAPKSKNAQDRLRRNSGGVEEPAVERPSTSLRYAQAKRVRFARVN